MPFPMNMIRFDLDAGNGGTGGSAGEGGQASQSGDQSGQAGSTILGGSQGSGAQQGGTGGQGSTIPDWASSLPDELKSNPRLASYKDLPSYIKDAEEAQKLIGKKGIIKPGENATPDEINKFYNELGRPEKAEGYSLKRPESWPEHLQFSDALVPKVQDMFHKAGVPQDMANKLWSEYHQMIAESADEQAGMAKADVERGLAALKQEWGGEEKYNANVETARMAVTEFGGDALVKFLNDTGLGDHPALIKAFANAGKNLREDGFVGNKSGGGALTQERAKAEIERLNNDKSFTDVLYSTKTEDRAAQKEAARKMEDLHKVAYPTFT